MRAVALLLLLPFAAGHGIHAYAQGRAANAGQTRADFLGVTQYTAAGCSNAQTCGPSYCVRGSNVDALNNRANMTDADFARQLAALTTRTCTISTDARCTAAGLSALFGRYPGVKAAYVRFGRCGARFGRCGGTLCMLRGHALHAAKGRFCTLLRRCALPRSVR